MSVQHIDIKTAYLYGNISEEVYMRQPPGFEVPGKEEYVCRLQRSIYGLRQSARCWNKRLDETLKKQQFHSSNADPCLYSRSVGNRNVYVLVYVDDLLIATENEVESRKIIKALNREFDLINLGEIRHFLGMEVVREQGVYKLGLRSYIDALLEKHGMKDAKTAKSPMDEGYLKNSDDKLLEDPTKYRSLVGGLLYIAVTVRPDISCCTSILGRKFNAPTEADWTAAKRVLRFLKGTKDMFLLLGESPDEALNGYSDADWAGDPNSRRSTSGYAFLFAGGMISWASRRQSSITLSSMEAEFVALSEACQEAIWLLDLLSDFGEQLKKPVLIREDNQSCLSFVQKEKSNRRSKHIDTKEKFIKELCDRKTVRLEYDTDMLADIFTKPCGPTKHKVFCEKLKLEERS